MGYASFLDLYLQQVYIENENGYKFYQYKGWAILGCLHITIVDEAKQFYPLFCLGANVALIFLQRTVKYFSHMR